MHVLLRSTAPPEARCNPWLNASVTDVLTDLWLEVFLSPMRANCRKQGVRHLGGVEEHDPHKHEYFEVLGGMSARQYARYMAKSKVWLPKAFPDYPDDTSGTHDPLHMSPAAMNDAPDNHVSSKINVGFSCRHGRAHNPTTF